MENIENRLSKLLGVDPTKLLIVNNLEEILPDRPGLCTLEDIDDKEYETELDCYPHTGTHQIFLPMESIVSKIESGVAVFLLRNPNDVLGNKLPVESLEQVIETCKKNQTILIIDEHYHEFTDKIDIQVALSQPHVAIFRPFSITVGQDEFNTCGYFIGNETLLEMLRTTPIKLTERTTKFINHVLDNRKELDEYVVKLLDIRDKTVDFLRKEHYLVIPTHTNWVYFNNLFFNDWASAKLKKGSIRYEDNIKLPRDAFENWIKMYLDSTLIEDGKLRKTLHQESVVTNRK